MQEQVRTSAIRQQEDISLPAHTVNARRIAKLVHNDCDFAVVLLSQDVAGEARCEVGECVYTVSACV